MVVQPYPRRALLVASLISALAGGACTDFASPAELTRPTILAVTADPPIVAPGAQAELTVAIADARGPMLGLSESWTLVETYPGVPPMGSLVGSQYHAPATIPPLPPNAPPIDTVRLDLDLPDGGTLTAIKVVPVAAAQAANPQISEWRVGDADALAPSIAGGSLTVARGASLALEVATEPPATADARYAWYSSAGEIVKYQSNPTEMVAEDAATDGWLFIVVRDGKGGVAWRGVEVVVE